MDVLGFFRAIRDCADDENSSRKNAQSASGTSVSEPFYKTVELIRLNCLRYLGFQDMTAIGRMTIKEYGLRMKAYRLKHVDELYMLHLQAWLNNQATATKQKGKKTVPFFKSFDEFFDIQEEEKKILGTPPAEIERSRSLSDLFRKANS